MRKIQASEAKTHLLRLLDEVEKGETVVITRHGKPVARIVPTKSTDADEVRATIEGIRALREEIRKTASPLTTEELLAMRHEGHKY